MHGPFVGGVLYFELLSVFRVHKCWFRNGVGFLIVHSAFVQTTLFLYIISVAQCKKKRKVKGCLDQFQFLLSALYKWMFTKKQWQTDLVSLAWIWDMGEKKHASLGDLLELFQKCYSVNLGDWFACQVYTLYRSHSANQWASLSCHSCLLQCYCQLK